MFSRFFCFLHTRSQIRMLWVIIYLQSSYLFLIGFMKFHILHFLKKSIVVLNDDNFSFYGHEGRICLLYFLIAIGYAVLSRCVLFLDPMNVSFDDMRSNS